MISDLIYPPEPPSTQMEEAGQFDDANTDEEDQALKQRDKAHFHHLELSPSAVQRTDGHGEPEDPAADEEELYEDELDDLESDLLGEGGSYHQSVNLSSLQHKFNDKLNVSQAVNSQIKNSEKITHQKRTLHTGRDDRATTEQCLDPRTRYILFKLLNQGFLTEINGCLSTGKEANVYYACNENSGAEYAIKVYKTSILVFKDRAKYVEGEYRFRKGFNKNNPRKMVKTWAEKEARNYKRLAAAGLPAPQVAMLKGHVLVMEFLGRDKWAAPRLKNAELGPKRLAKVYWECVRCMRCMVQDCNLVHGDLSEYNMLYHEGKLYIIDVSQSVELDHPHALDFLRMDCKNVNDFFKYIESPHPAISHILAPFLLPPPPPFLATTAIEE